MTTEAQKLRALLVKWYADHADALSGSQMREELRSVGIDPDEDPARGAKCAYCFGTDHHTVDHLTYCLTNPVTKVPYDLPAGLRDAIEFIWKVYPRDCLPNGQSDPMYLANVIAVRTGMGNGESEFSFPSKRSLEWIKTLLDDIDAPGFLGYNQRELIGKFPEDVRAWLNSDLIKVEP